MKTKMKSKFPIISFLTATLLIAGSYSVSAAEITFFDQIMTENGKIYLQDIAKIVPTGTKENIEALARTYICNSPRVGFKRELDREFIMMRLKQKDMDLSKVVFEGARYTTITRKEGLVRTKSIHEALVAWVGRRVGLQKEQFAIDIKTDLNDIRVPFGKVTIKFKGRKETFVGRNVGVTVEVYVNGEFFKRKGITFQLLVFQNVAQTLRPIERGDVFTEENVAVVRSLVGSDDRDFFFKLDQVLGGVARKKLDAGVVLRRVDYGKRQVIKNGDLIDSAITEKNMKMTIRLRATESGAIGDVIRLNNPATSKTVLGRIVGEKQVELLV